MSETLEEMRISLDAARKIAKDSSTNAARWEAFRDAVKGYMREDLINARNGQVIPGKKHWTIWLELPDHAMLDSAIDEMLKKEQTT